MITGFFFDKNFHLARHILYVFILSALIFAGDGIISIKVGAINTMLLRIALFSTLLFLFYLHYFFLIPKVILKQRYGTYFITLLLVYLVIFALMVFTERFLGFSIQPETYLGWTDFIGLSIILTVYVLAVGSLQLFKSSILTQIRYRDLENASLKIRLNQLESQINPHFLFNMLNNIHLLIEESPQKADTMLIHLSDILRHQLYVMPNQNISLIQEIKVLQSILQLEQMRREIYIIDFKLEGNPENIEIPRYMFLPFVENAIKHGLRTSSTAVSYDIKIILSVLSDDLIFTCSNPAKKTVKGHGVGVGLTNIRKRLEILFPAKHEINISQNEELFEVSLKIPAFYEINK
ncbi:putative regulator of cell autolysis [Chryseobacterium sp. StRB126]|uniref:sensor histidine kinase n=1 Tax=Chryseobacterium sp. StRB126 TaxID=878220 RepID=UPI0004E983DE|nr:histidine kinase [Chryseobacterium sp. StRB126]BAP32311.1 putative regulator of cell autolysis [Chryseobacterium sp. StRB126]